jgi:hypothetical protein
MWLADVTQILLSSTSTSEVLRSILKRRYKSSSYFDTLNIGFWIKRRGSNPNYQLWILLFSTITHKVAMVYFMLNVMRCGFVRPMLKNDPICYHLEAEKKFTGALSNVIQSSRSQNLFSSSIRAKAISSSGASSSSVRAFLLNGQNALLL